ncbi:DUF7563 family protein [Halococcus saccharolyticus]
MYYCQGCGAVVTDMYARVCAPPDIHRVRVCPECDDKARDGADVRETYCPRYYND